MDISNITVGLAFLAGLASFLSPCVFSLVPAYIGYLGGRAAGGEANANNRWITFSHGLAFVLGFSFVFVVLGIAVSAAGHFLYDLRFWLAKIGGVVVIIFGLHMIGVFRIPFLEYDVRVHTLPDRRWGYLSSALMGVFFSAGWSPCVGPVLSVILTFALNGGEIGLGAKLLTFYSAGLAIPFLVAALGIGWVSNILRKHSKVMHYVEIAMGVILVIIGFMLLAGIFELIAQRGQFFWFDFGIDIAELIVLTVTLYTRKDCSLCDETKAHLGALEKELPHRLVEVDIDSDPVLQKAYGQRIPVVEIGPYTLVAPISKEQLQMTLGAASDRRNQLERVGGETYEARVRRGLEITTGDRVSNWISKHYLALLNLFMAIYVGLPFLAPTLMKAGADLPARAIYTIYSPLCHQFGFRSFFLYGEQAYYPLSEAGLEGVKTFEEITGFENLDNPNSVSRLQARAFVGNETAGYKVALCERDVAIYFGLLLFGLVFGLTKRRLPALHWMLWLFIGLSPIGLDGFSQLFSQFNFPWLANILSYRESTPFLRVLTGALFGFSTAWFAYPYVEESMAETRQFFLKKFAIAKK